MVQAVRIIGCNAFGGDFSDYVFTHCDAAVKGCVSSPNENKNDILICKDMLENVPELDIPGLLQDFKWKSNRFFFFIPLGDENRFRIREYEVDVTHVTKKDEEWWVNMFSSQGLKLKKFSYSMGSMKRNWIDQYPYGNGFFTLES